MLGMYSISFSYLFGPQEYFLHILQPDYVNNWEMNWFNDPYEKEPV